MDQKGKSIGTQILLRMVLCLKNIKNYVSFVWLNLLLTYEMKGWN